MSRNCLICKESIVTLVLSSRRISLMKYCAPCRAAIWVEYHKIQKLNWAQAIEAVKSKLVGAT
jgi:hypothetical protein